MRGEEKSNIDPKFPSCRIRNGLKLSGLKLLGLVELIFFLFL